MARLIGRNLTLDYPIYGTSKSFRREVIGRAIGGVIRQSAGESVATVRALSGVDFAIEDGDRVGLIGHNGSGKTTLLKVLGGIYHPTSGELIREGNICGLFNTSPGLDTDDTGYEAIKTCGMFLGMTDVEIAKRTPDIEEFSELGDFLHFPVRTYSAGMMLRLGLAIATTLEPEVLLLDELISAGDARFAIKAKARIEQLISRASIFVLASHSTEIVKSMCNKALLMEHGRIKAFGDVDAVIEQYGA